MNEQPELKPAGTGSETTKKTDNPMQERYCGQVVESVQVAAEAVFTARRSEAGGEAGPVLVP